MHPAPAGEEDGAARGADGPGAGESGGAVGPGPAGGAGGGATGEVPLTLIRQALEAAWLVGRAGLAATPPVQPPRRLRPLLRFARLPAKGLATVREVVEADEEFRALVAASLDAGADRASWLWLRRPEGWSADLASLDHAARAAALDAHESRAEQSARRRLEAAEAGRARSDEAAVAARRVASERLDDLARERQVRRAAEGEVAGLVSELGQARADAERARHALAGVEERARDAEEVAASARASLEAAAEEQRRQSAQVAALSEALAVARAGEVRVRAETADRQGRLGRAVLDAAHAAEALGAALARAARELDGDAAGGPRSDGAGSEGPGSGGGGSLRVGSPRRKGVQDAPGAQDAGAQDAGRAPRDRRGPPSSRRRPVSIPSGLFGDSAEVAAYLVRLPSAVLLVDGYNVSLNTWPGASLADQRERLTAALAELAARSGASIHVVFDASAEERVPPPAGAARQAVRVSFSHTGEDADEVLIALVDRSDAARPVVLATDDRRVRTEGEQRGANTISVAQLLAVLGRRPQDR